MPKIKCSYCGKEFHRKPSWIKETKQNVCSRSCFAQIRKGKRYGKKTEFKKRNMNLKR